MIKIDIEKLQNTLRQVEQFAKETNCKKLREILGHNNSDLGLYKQTQLNRLEKLYMKLNRQYNIDDYKNYSRIQLRKLLNSLRQELQDGPRT